MECPGLDLLSPCLCLTQSSQAQDIATVHKRADTCILHRTGKSQDTSANRGCWHEFTAWSQHDHSMLKPSNQWGGAWSESTTNLKSETFQLQLRLGVHNYRGSNVLSLKPGKDDVGGGKNCYLAEHRKNVSEEMEHLEESVGVSTCAWVKRATS